MSFESLIYRYCDWKNSVYLGGTSKNSPVEVTEHSIALVLVPGTVDTVILTATLCGVEMEGDLLIPDVKGHFTYYPVLLVKSTVAMTDVLITWLMVYM